MFEYLNRPAPRPVADDDIFKALADPSRRQILRALRGGPMMAWELHDRLDARMSKPSVSHHFTVLKAAGLVTSFRQWHWTYYELNRSMVNRVLDLFQDLVPARPPKESES